MITYHHIGGRNGTYPLPLKNSVLLKDFHLILYDADANCYEQMKNAEQNAWGKVSIYPYCIGQKTEQALFHLNFHPTTNSLYPFNEEYSTYGYVDNPRYGEYMLGDACKHIESIELNMFSLEEALKLSQAPSVDFLSLDVQGAEYDIIEGAKTLLQKDCIGIQLEAEFVKLYKNQKTFFDINSLLESMGFELIDLRNFGRCAPISLPIGFRGVEQPLYAEALYLKRADRLVEENNIAGLYKAALFSLIYQKMGLCLKFLIKAVEKDKSGDDYAIPYKRCLFEIWNLFEKSKSYKLPQISQLFSNKMFQDYYKEKNNSGITEIREVTRERLRDLLPIINNLYRSDNAPLEEILKKYGLHEVADAVKQNRLFEAKCFLELANDINLTQEA